jgi:hypothetical protein
MSTASTSGPTTTVTPIFPSSATVAYIAHLLASCFLASFHGRFPSTTTMVRVVVGCF